MKQNLTIAILLSALAISLTAQAQERVRLAWDFAPTPDETGGLTTNDYLTNIVFTIWSTSNVKMDPTNWTKVATVPGTIRQVTLTIENKSLFFVARTEGLRDVSPFSNVAPWVKSSTSGVLLPPVKVP